MFILLMLGSGLFWTATYLLIIRQSILDHTYGMPMVALCANIAWELIFSFILPSPGIQHIVNIVWFSLDVGILICYLRYGSGEFASLSKKPSTQYFASRWQRVFARYCLSPSNSTMAERTRHLVRI